MKFTSTNIAIEFFRQDLNKEQLIGEIKDILTLYYGTHKTNNQEVDNWESDKM